MGGNPRPQTWGHSDWRRQAPTVSAIRAKGWPVHAACHTCQLEMKVDLARIERDRGPDFVLWGHSAKCRRRRCEGGVIFMVSPPGSVGAVPML